jgi:hypothetical protein
MRMGKILALAGSLTLFIAQCANSPSETQTQTQGSESKSVRIAITTPAHFDTIASSACVRVSAKDMSTIIEQPLSICDTQITGVVPQIPAGYNRKFEVFVYGYDSTVRYSGSAYADIFANDTTLVSIILRKPGGTAIISGYIEDMPITSDSISQPATPYIDSTEVNLASSPRSIIHLRTNGSTSSDTSRIGYKWTFWGVNATIKDSIFKEIDGTTILTDTFPADGNYRVTVMAYLYRNPQITSSVSNALVYEIRNGLLVDTIDSLDKVPPVLKLIGSDSMRIALNDTFFDPGATAYDNVEGDLTYKISKSGYVNSSVSGVYLLNYKVTDKAGNSASAARIVIVTGTLFDTIAPVITLVGSQSIYLNLNDTFVEPGFTAYDNVDGDITSKVTKRFTTQIDSGSSQISKVIYSVVDAAGNMASAYRLIIYSSMETVSQPVKPSVISSKSVQLQTTPTTFARSITFSTDAIVTSSGDSVFYDWTIKSPLDSAVNKSTTTRSMEYTFENSGLHAITVRARCMVHAGVQSENSLPLWIDTSSSVVADTLM